MHELRITYMVHACMHACKPCALKQWPGRSVMNITLLTAVEEKKGIVHYNKGNMKLLDHFNPTSLRVVISFETLTVTSAIAFIPHDNCCRFLQILTK